MVDLIPSMEEPFHGVEQGCGEGLLAEATLQRYQGAIYHRLDGSSTMLDLDSDRLTAFSGQYDLAHFELAERSWRTFPRSLR